MPDDLNNLPPSLRATLHRLEAPPPVPPEIDASILARAQAMLRFRRFRRRALLTVAAAGAAATIGLVAWLGTSRHQAQPFAAAPKQHVDILDAFALARDLDAHGTPAPAWDANRDGRVDRQDVQALAAAAVSLHREAM